MIPLAPPGTRFKAIAAGYDHSLALTQDGTVVAWGNDDWGQATVPNGLNGVIAVAAGAFHSLALVGVMRPSPIILTQASELPSGAFQFAFTNMPGLSFSVWAATNPALPLSNWTGLGSVTGISPGQYQFTDLQATSTPRRYYRVRCP